MSDLANQFYAQLHQDAQKLCSARLFTITVLDRPNERVRRAYSSDPDAYPVSGTKPMREDGWSEKVIDRAEPFVANETKGFSIYFPDHELINQLGCEAVVNIPVCDDAGLVVGTVNILDEAGHYTPERVATVVDLIKVNNKDLLVAFASTDWKQD